jgi:hypothetical protein
MSTDSEHIRSLLERYYQAETTIEEERTLRTLLGGHLPDQDLMLDAAVLAAHDEYRTIQMPGSFPDALLHRISRDKPLYRLRALAIAASIALVITVGWWIARTGQVSQPHAILTTDTFQDPDEALVELEAALQLISTHFAHGIGVSLESLEPVEELDILIQ